MADNVARSAKPGKYVHPAGLPSPPVTPPLPHTLPRSQCSPRPLPHTPKLQVSDADVACLQAWYQQQLNPDIASTSIAPAPLSLLQMERLRDVYTTRRSIFEAACRHFTTQAWAHSRSETMVPFLSPANKTFCLFPKVATTFMSAVFSIVEGTFAGVRSPLFLTFQQTYQVVEKLKVPFSKVAGRTDVEKIMVVRDPYLRLYSGYLDKLFTVNPVFWSQEGAAIVTNCRPSASPKKPLGHDVTFAEFVHHVVKSGETSNLHFRPMHLFPCLSCDVKYDVIMHLETFRNDSFYLMQDLHILGENVTFRDFSREGAYNRIIDKVQQIYTDVAAVTGYLSLEQALLRTWRFLQLYGYVDVSSTLPRGLARASFEDVVRVFLQAFDKRSQGAALQRQQAFLQAVLSVPQSTWSAYRQLFRPDFQLFGYDPEPPHLFADNESKVRDAKKQFQYFDILKES